MKNKNMMKKCVCSMFVLVFLCFSSILLFSYVFPVPALCFSCGAAVLFSYNLPTKSPSTIDDFGVPGDHILDMFGVLGAPWAPSGAKGALAIVLGYMLGRFPLPFMTP